MVQNRFVNELRHFSRKLIRELGMLELNKTHRTPQHWHTLIEIHNEPKITITKLANLLLLTNSALSRIVSTLIKEGLVLSTPGVDKRKNCLELTQAGLAEIQYIDQFSNSKILGAFEFLTEGERIEIIGAIKKYSCALEKSRSLQEQIKIHTLSTSRTIRKQIIALIEDIQKNEYSLPITEDINSGILKAETDYYYDNSYNFWYAIDLSGQIIGSIGLKKLNDENAEIKKFFVHANYRGKKIALKLISAAAKAALKHQFKNLWLGTVSSLKAAQHFYEKYGFNEVVADELPEEFIIGPLDTIFYQGKLSHLLKKIDAFS